MSEEGREGVLHIQNHRPQSVREITEQIRAVLEPQGEGNRVQAKTGFRQERYKRAIKMERRYGEKEREDLYGVLYSGQKRSREDPAIDRPRPVLRS